MPFTAVNPDDDAALPAGDSSSLTPTGIPMDAMPNTRQIVYTGAAPGPSIPAASIGPAQTQNQPSFWDTILPTAANLFVAKQQSKQAAHAAGDAAAAAQIAKNAAADAQARMLAQSGKMSSNTLMLLGLGAVAIAALFYFRKPRST